MFSIRNRKFNCSTSLFLLKCKEKKIFEIANVKNISFLRMSITGGKIASTIPRIPQLNLAVGYELLLEQRNLFLRCRFRRFIFGSRCNREKYGEHESIPSKNVEGRAASWSRRRGSEGAACPYEELFKTRVKVADLLRSSPSHSFTLPFFVSVAFSCEPF